MATELTYEEAVRLFELTNGSGEFQRLEQAWANWGREVSAEDIVDVLKTQGWKDIGSAKVKVAESATGNVKGYVGEFYGNYPSVVDSNITTSGSIRTPINTTATVVEETPVMTAKVGLREAGNFAIGSVVPAVAAAGLGITLGKTIDSTLYNLNPDFWDAHNLSTLNPETWNEITSDYDGVAGTLFDLIFGIDSDGNTQAYIDEDAAAYLAWYLSEMGAFASGEVTTSFTEIPRSDFTAWNDFTSKFPDPVKNGGGFTFTFKSGSQVEIDTYFENSNQRVIVTKTANDSSFRVTTIGKTNQLYKIRNGSQISISPIPALQTVIDGVTYYINSSYITPSSYYTINTPAIANVAPTKSTFNAIEAHDLTLILWYGTRAESAPVEGIGTQDGATTPNTTGWNGVDSTKQSLQQQYPQLWDGAKHQDYVDENGTNKSTTLIPINLPNVKSPTDIFPTSGNRSQDDPLIDPDTATKDLIDTITKLISGGPPINPPTTGGGDSPVVPVPVGRASSLWKIYNPTQAQVDSFGAWLWDSSFVEQIKKLFNDPMQAIIGIHKVFATPSIGGTATIKVGYLDSQVPSDWVDNQYTTINCGTVNLSEYFGNVFDYSPYTKVSIYLPFIGIVDLDVADIMRSSITVIYHVDVLTGACLADVKVSRDLATAVLYQYAGSAIVSYPVSSGNYMGMVAGVLSVASGIAGTVLSGGALAPALIGGAVGASHLHTDVSKSGGFSGSAGAMGGKTPYLIISRPQTAMADNYGHFTGRPANSHVILRNCSGMTRVKTVYVGNMNATDEEKAMIESQLKAGVLV